MLTLIDTIAAMDISGASYGSQGATSATSTTKTVFLAAIKAMQTNLANMVANVEGALKSTQLILEQRPHILRCLRLSAIRDHPILNVTILERINDYKNVLKHIAKDVEKERAKIEAAPVVVPEHKQTIQGLLDQFMEESLTLEQFFVEYNERAGAPSN
ncbi:hypothetical protein EC991_005149 [Linnemannia zychae]|nr:hypothetical protein EC991_005149 [Linnemannia zychae]